MNTPAIGDWLLPRDGWMAGMVVDILPSGKQCVLARVVRGEMVETAHDTASLKGPMRGRPVTPVR
jgi:hypothetical protein